METPVIVDAHKKGRGGTKKTSDGGQEEKNNALK